MHETEIYARYGAKQRITQAAQALAKKLNKEIEKGHDTIAFSIAILLATFKDFFDLIIFLTGTSVYAPGVSMLTGLFLSSFLYFFLLGKGWFLKWRIRLEYWVLCLFFDGLPGFEALPINTLMVLYAWRLTKKRMRHAEVKMKELEVMTEVQITALNKDISLLESDKFMAKISKEALSFVPKPEPKTISFNPERFQKPSKNFDSIDKRRAA